MHLYRSEQFQSVHLIEILKMGHDKVHWKTLKIMLGDGLHQKKQPHALIITQHSSVGTMNRCEHD